MAKIFIFKNTGKAQINNVSFHLEKLVKEEPTKHKVNKKKKIIKLKTEINEM